MILGQFQVSKVFRVVIIHTNVELSINSLNIPDIFESPAIRYDTLEERSLHLAVEEGVADSVVIVVRREKQRECGGAGDLQRGPVQTLLCS